VRRKDLPNPEHLRVLKTDAAMTVPDPDLYTGWRVSMDTTFSRWADACVPVWRTEEIRVDGQVLHVGDQAGRVGVSFFHLPSPGLWAVWATLWGCPSGVVRPAARPVS